MASIIKSTVSPDSIVEAKSVASVVNKLLNPSACTTETTVSNKSYRYLNKTSRCPNSKVLGQCRHMLVWLVLAG